MSTGMMVDGLDELADRMEKLGIDMEGEIADKMLIAGAEVMKAGWVSQAESEGLRDSGEMIRHIGFNKKPKNIRGIRTVEVYPQGSQTRGKKKKSTIRNAAIAFYVHYREGKKGAGWVDRIHSAKEAEAVAAMEAVLDKEIKERGL